MNDGGNIVAGIGGKFGRTPLVISSPESLYAWASRVIASAAWSCSWRSLVSAVVTSAGLGPSLA
ncbi:MULTISPECIES: hypothetical protein [Streptomyces]|uniref:hypothetical protein n=1 Tax=Streptomyces TaxID=1883 RepID=UPI00163C7182|nr:MULTISPECIES: hypothetical protein [Streptomyces]MBC2877713.1 hypothetical protein [Streptomyces sp. TYQ1024]UBI38620.1 hypothetical protein K7I03_20580 [Streptomyces mobaraensis]UKW31202.1 hypothetical protein MCU78_20535 [Streptomyces sp. TYQ1024]